MASRPRTLADRQQERIDEARLRAEYFARGGTITHYPRGARGPDPRAEWRERMRKQAIDRAAKRKAWREGRIYDLKGK